MHWRAVNIGDTWGVCLNLCMRQHCHQRQKKRVVLPFDTQVGQGFADAQACKRKSDYDLTACGECTSHAAGCMARQPIVLLGLNFRRG